MVTSGKLNGPPTDAGVTCLRLLSDNFHNLIVLSYASIKDKEILTPIVMDLKHGV